MPIAAVSAQYAAQNSKTFALRFVKNVAFRLWYPALPSSVFMLSNLVSARSLLEEEITTKGLKDVELTDDGDYIRIDLRAEQRSIWLGHADQLGYFLTWDRYEPSSRFFRIGHQIDVASAAISQLSTGPEMPRVQETIDEKAQQLLSSIASEEPSPAIIQQVLDEVPATEEGLDVLATIAALKKSRMSVNRLRMLLSQVDVPEAKYRSLLASCPWMLGSQYTDLLVQEYFIWIGLRVDLIVASAIGCVDIVELKRPDLLLLVRGQGSLWRASAALSSAIAQANGYLRALDEHRFEIEEKLISTTKTTCGMYRSSVIILGGRTPDESDARQRLRDLRMENSRLLIVTYDDLLSIANATVVLFERRLKGSGKATHSVASKAKRVPDSV